MHSFFVAPSGMIVAKPDDVPSNRSILSERPEWCLEEHSLVVEYVIKGLVKLRISRSAEVKNV